MALATMSSTYGADGRYYVATNPTPGTGIASLTAPTTYDDTKPFLLINNAHASRTLTLDYIKLVCTAPGTAGTALNYVHKIDGVNASRYTSGGSTLSPKNVNQGSSEASSAVIYCGAIVAIATSSAARKLGSGVIRPVIPVIGDTYLFTFNAFFGAGLGGQAVAGTAIANVIIPSGPILIAPTGWYALHLWLPSQSAASSYEAEVGFVEA